MRQSLSCSCARQIYARLLKGFVCEVAERAVWSTTVALDAPVSGEDLGFEQRVDMFTGEELVAESAAKGLSESVLPGRARRANASLTSPTVH